MADNLFNFVKRKLFAVRTVVAVISFAMISAYFLDIHHSLGKPFYLVGYIKTQIAPGLLKWIAGGGVALAFVIFSVCALVFGRIYCSAFCPFGILSDVLRRIALMPFKLAFIRNSGIGKLIYRKFFLLKYAKAHNGLRAAILVVSILLIAFGATAWLGLIEPYSLFGKITASVFRPLLTDANNVLATVLPFLRTEPEPTIVPAFAFLTGLALLLGLFAASAMKGRIFCNTLCPLGAWLGLLSRFSLFRISFDESECRKCGACIKNCKAQCIDIKNRQIDSSRCIMCFNCMKGCGSNALAFKFSYKLHAQDATVESMNVSRRLFLKSSAAALGAAGMGAAGISKRESPCTPPGSQSTENFASRCTACQLCVSSCKGNVLKPSLTAWGFGGFMRPYMDFESGYCREDCHNCSKVCPTGAINFVTVAQKKEIKIGDAKIDHDKCLIKSGNQECTVCADKCPQDAIAFPQSKNSHVREYLPKVRPGHCIGCGTCAYVCPATPKAITITPFSVHEKPHVVKKLAPGRKA